jgi:hypothetical protein
MNLEIDLDFVEKTQIELLELKQIVEQKQYSKDAVLAKMDNIYNSLNRLNTVQHETVKQLALANKNWSFSTGQAFDSLILGYEEALATSEVKLKEIIEAYSDIEAGRMPKDATPINAYDFERSNADINIIKENLKILPILLGLDHHIELSNKRLKIAMFSRLKFMSKQHAAKTANIILSTIIGLISESLFSALIPKVPPFATTLIVAILSGFILNSFFDRKFDTIFWKDAMTYTFRLIKQLELLKTQIVNIQNYLTTKS